jgi:hypothetical protein
MFNLFISFCCRVISFHLETLKNSNGRQRVPADRYGLALGTWHSAIDRVRHRVMTVSYFNRPQVSKVRRLFVWLFPLTNLLKFFIPRLLQRVEKDYSPVTFILWFIYEFSNILTVKREVGEVWPTPREASISCPWREKFSVRHLIQ